MRRSCGSSWSFRAGHPRARIRRATVSSRSARTATVTSRRPSRPGRSSGCPRQRENSGASRARAPSLVASNGQLFAIMWAKRQSPSPAFVLYTSLAPPWAPSATPVSVPVGFDLPASAAAALAGTGTSVYQYIPTGARAFVVPYTCENVLAARSRRALRDVRPRSLSPARYALSGRTPRRTGDPARRHAGSLLRARLLVRHPVRRPGDQRERRRDERAGHRHRVDLSRRRRADRRRTRSP